MLHVVITHYRPKSGRRLSNLRPHYRRFFAHAAIKIERLTPGPAMSNPQLKVWQAGIYFLEHRVSSTCIQQNIVADRGVMLHRLSASHGVSELAKANGKGSRHDEPC